MIVWHLLSNRWNSAITEYALSAARALELEGHKSIFSALAMAPAAKRAAGVGLTTRPVPAFSLVSLPVLVRIAKEVRPAVIMTYGGPETVVSKALQNVTGARIVRFRGQAVEGSGLLSAARQRLSHGHVDLLLTPSRVLAESLKLGQPGKRIESVILGCDTAKFRRLPPATPASKEARPEVVVLGRLDPVKGHAELFEIFAEFLRQWGRPTKPRLHVVGEPANISVAELETLAARAALRVGEDVTFTSTRVEKIAELLSAAALGVVPSLGSEAIARVTEEFLLCGTPVVVSGVGSLEEPLFPGAGASYRGMSHGRAATLLKTWLETSLGEGEVAKAQRAAQAAKAFSLENMGRALDELLRQPSTRR